MEFESRIAWLATGLFLLGSYIVPFDLWEYSGFLLMLSSLLLLLVAFRDHRPGKMQVLLAAAATGFFLIYPADKAYLPVVLLLVAALLAIKAKIEVFIPPLIGLIALRFLQPDLVLGGFRAVLSGLSSLLHLHYGLSETGYLILYHTRALRPILLDDVKVLLPFYVSLSLVAIALILIVRAERRAKLWSALAALAIPFLFLILSLQSLLYVPRIATFIPDNLQALLLPLACVLLLCFSLPEATIRRIGGGYSSKRWMRALPLLMAFLMLAVVYFTPLATRADPIIIIDETHSVWEPTWTDYLQTNAKDAVSGSNNYFGLMNIISRIYNITLIGDRPDKRPDLSYVGYVEAKEIDLSLLEKISQGRKAVLVLKCITSPYSEREVEAIMKFVAQGNGLILIGEHTDIYGMATNINPIAERLGYRYLATGVQDVYTDSRGSLTRIGEMPQFMARYMTGDLLWETSTSLERLDGAKPLFEIETWPSYFADYRNETSAFFLTRDFPDEVKLNGLFGRHLVWAAVGYGKGKAVLFTDSTQFNNGVIGVGEHLQIFLAMVEYVSCAEMLDKTLPLLLMMAVALAIVVRLRKESLSAIIVLFLILLVAYNISYPLAHYTTEFPELKGDSKMVLLRADENYLNDYLSGLYDLDKLMDRYFRMNLTAIIMPNPSKEWAGISDRVEDLQSAIVNGRPALYI